MEYFVEFLKLAFFGLLIPLIVGTVFYFLIVNCTKIPPKGIGKLVPSIWSMIILYFAAYLIFLSPAMVRVYFAPMESIGFWVSMIVGLIIIAVLWLTKAR